ncbi:TetR/AcrR family transcriptional regulator [Falsiroseomonas oryzae]|uniref:TetR/AcrR family transcriptional regulator n=1 Tax=Falsiroseomonas oryzae TaxID=2766473 RepID=UPI0022EB52A5|nr:TetR/AcrR family transcriptional regulator [Roseomonas sp. MO-31]
MLAADRREHILREATAYFAEFGLSAGTIELARRVGITQPLLYKYFATKEVLLVAVYERLFPQNWDPALEALLEDAAKPVEERLIAFYRHFAHEVLTYEHVRLFLFSGLTNSALNAAYYAILTRRIFTRIAKALRREFLDDPGRGRVGHAELELVQSLHAAIYHVAFRRWLHGLSVEADLDELIAQKVRIFLGGAGRELVGIAAGRGRSVGRARKPAAPTRRPRAREGA